MKVVYLNGSYYPYIGGVENYNYALAENMKNRHISIEVITGDVGINCYKAELISGIVVHRVPVRVTPFGIFLKRGLDKKTIKNI